MKKNNSWRGTKENLAILVLSFFVIVSILALWWTPYNPHAVSMTEILSPPSFMHPLGTDALGRDLLSRLMIAASTTLFFGVVAAALIMTVGVFLGVMSGYVGGSIDMTVQSVINVFQTIPSISLMIALAGVLDPGFSTMLLALLIGSWAGFSRIIRGSVISIKKESYIEGARTLGASHLFIIKRHILRSILPLAIVLFTIRIGHVILAVSSLSFIGLGMQDPFIDWGMMVNEGMTYFRSYPLLIYAPGISILLVCLSINIIGEGLKKKFL